MADGTGKPVIFISYSHLDEPERTPEGDIHWLTDIQTYLAPATNGTFELWTDEDMAGGADWEKEIKDKLAACDICILFVSRHSLASKYVIEVEIATILERQRNGHDVQIYPIVLSPFPQAAAPASLLALNLRPRLDKPLSGFSRHRRGVEISKIADEIVGLLGKKVTGAASTIERVKPPSYVHITGLPETAYERLVGREDRLKRLDDAWADNKANIVSLIAEGGAGKSALVNEWLKRLQADNYRGAEAVLGWSFYSQGTKERATAADEFFNWALDKLNIKFETTSASAKGEAIAEAMMQRRVLLVLDGVEPLQHGLDTQLGQLKDQGLRALLRRFGATPPAQLHGLIVLTSRLAVKDIARWQDGAAPVVDVERLSDEAGAALLRDNGVWGTDNELKKAAHDFGGHALALGLLASFLKETQKGNVRQRDHIRGLVLDKDNPRHDHAKRVMESYEKEWLAGQPVLLAILHMVGLFDRPATEDCIRALRAEPAIVGLTDQIVKLDDGEWQRAVARLSDVRLLAPPDPVAPSTLDAHPLVREWFGERLEKTNSEAWKAAHGRIYEHIRDTTREIDEPTLENLAPLYQAIAHGCWSGRYEQALIDIYANRILKRDKTGGILFYSKVALGAYGSDLAAISCFFQKPYSVPAEEITNTSQKFFLLGEAGSNLRAQVRLAEALATFRAALNLANANKQWIAAANTASNISHVTLSMGQPDEAIKAAEACARYAGREKYSIWNRVSKIDRARGLLAKGEIRKAIQLLTVAANEASTTAIKAYAMQIYTHCDALLASGSVALAAEYLGTAGIDMQRRTSLLDEGMYTLAQARVFLGLSYESTNQQADQIRRRDIDRVGNVFDASVDKLRVAAHNEYVSFGLLYRATLRRSIGDLNGASRDLDEVEDTAESGPMPLSLCDTALERARLAFAKIEAFAPLNGMLKKGNPPMPTVPSTEQIAELKSEAEQQLKIAADYIEKCSYHRRDQELAELQAVLRGERRFADLPPRV